jgi:transposase-like protein
MRNTFRYTQYWGEMSQDPRPEVASNQRFGKFSAKWGRQRSMNAIESENARWRRAVTTTGRLPGEQVALIRLYLAIRAPKPLRLTTGHHGPYGGSGTGPFAITFDGRIN